MKSLRVLIILVAAMSVMTGALAKEYPSRPVKVIVPYTKGSATDVIARMVSNQLSKLWKQSVVVENRPGAGGTIGAGDVAKSARDGYTLLVHSSSYAVNLAAYTSLPYSKKDFTDIAPLARQPYTLVVNPSAGMKSVSELIAAAKAKPGQIKFGSAGKGSSTHLVAERFKSTAGIDVMHVPYKGGPEANAATATGKVTYWFPPTAIAVKGVKDGKFLALGVSGTNRSVLLPDVPTIAEVAITGFEANVWWGIWAPAGIPVKVKEQLMRDVARALNAPDLHDMLSKRGFETMDMTAAKFSQLVEDEIESAASTLKAAGIAPK